MRMLSQLGCDVVAYESAEGFLQKLEPSLSQCLVLDLCLPGMSGIELLATMRDARNILPTVVLSCNDDVVSVVDSIQGGAIDFLPKPVEREPFRQCVEKLLKCAPEFAAERRIATRVVECIERLSPRECEAFTLLVDGKTPKQVARALGLRPRTAHIHCSNVLAKFSVENPNDLLLLRARLAGGPYASSIAYRPQS